jgi:trans-aconitate 2-methyltransferase
MWETLYIHILDSQELILEWIRSTGLKPYLDRLEKDEMKNEFEKDILEEIKKYYPVQKNGKVIFPFKRLFFIAHK